MIQNHATNLLLVRHALHDHGPDVLCGRMPGVALGPAGLAQLPDLRRHIGGDVAAIYSSPQPRCRKTAAAIGPYATEDGLDEIDFGQWMGCRFKELDGRADWRAWNTDRDHGRTPGGETAMAAQNRAVTCVGRIADRHAGQTVVLVSHADIIRAILSHHAGTSMQAFGAVEIRQASVHPLVLHTIMTPA